MWDLSEEEKFLAYKAKLLDEAIEDGISHDFKRYELYRWILVYSPQAQKAMLRPKDIENRLDDLGLW